MAFSLCNIQDPLTFSLLPFGPLGSASVVLVVYNSMRDVLKEGLRETATMMSKVISVILANTTNKALQTPVNLTIQHLKVGLNFILDGRKSISVLFTLCSFIYLL